MDEDLRFRVQQVAEDAADGSWLIVPEPPVDWICDECYTRNGGRYVICGYCGLPRDGADEEE